MNHWTVKIDSVYQILLIDVKGKTVKIQGKGFEIKEQFEESGTCVKMSEVIEVLGVTHSTTTPSTIAYKLSLDILDLDQEVVLLGGNTKELMLRLLRVTLEKAMPFFQTIIKQENMPLLIVSSATKDMRHMTVTAGLLEDTQVLLLDVVAINQEEQEIDHETNIFI